MVFGGREREMIVCFCCCLCFVGGERLREWRRRRGDWVWVFWGVS